MAPTRRRATPRRNPERNPLSVDPASLQNFAAQVETAVRELDSIDWPDRQVIRDVIEHANGDGSAFATDLRTLAELVRKYG